MTPSAPLDLFRACCEFAKNLRKGVGGCLCGGNKTQRLTPLLFFGVKILTFSDYHQKVTACVGEVKTNTRVHLVSCLSPFKAEITRLQFPVYYTL